MDVLHKVVCLLVAKKIGWICPEEIAEIFEVDKVPLNRAEGIELVGCWKNVLALSFWLQSGEVIRVPTVRNYARANRNIAILVRSSCTK